MISEKKLKNDYYFWEQFVTNLKTNFLRSYIWIRVLAVLLLFILDYLLFREIEISFFERAFTINLIVMGITLLILMLTKNAKTVVTYAYFTLIAKSIACLFMFISHDVGIVFSKTGLNLVLLPYIFTIISSLISIGISFLSTLLLISIAITAIINLIDARVLNKLLTTKSRMIWFIFLVLIEVGVFYILFRFINNFYYTIAGSLFNSIIDVLVKIKVLKIALARTFIILRTFVAFGWFPLIITVNNIRGTDIFSSKNAQFYLATQFVFLESYVNIYHATDPNLFIPKVIIAYTVFKILMQFTLFGVALTRLSRASKNMTEIYVPPRISFAAKFNSSVKLFLYSQKYRMYKNYLKTQNTNVEKVTTNISIPTTPPKETIKKKKE